MASRDSVAWDSNDESSENWFIRFEGRCYHHVKQCQDENAKNTTLLNELCGQIGKDGFSLLSSLVDGKLMDKTYQDLKKILVDHRKPNRIAMVERYELSMCTQNGRSIPEYVTELYQKSKHCEFGIKLSEHLRDRFVFGLDKAEVRSQILHSEDAKKNELTFNRAVELAKAIVAVNAAETLLKKPNSVLQTQPKRHQRDKKAL